MIHSLGSIVLRNFTPVFGMTGFFFETLFVIFRQFFRRRFRCHLIVEQMYVIGVESLPVILFSMLITSLMLIMEFTYHMELVLGQSSLVPAFSTIFLIRELGPVVTSLLLTSRVGAGIAAEIGSMKVTEQIDALKLLSLDPMEFLVFPRWVASVFAAVCLSLLALGISILGGSFLASITLNQSFDHFLNTMFIFANFQDLMGCIIKAAVFGTIIPLVASYHGLVCRRGSHGVGEAATAAVVQGSVLIIVADFLLTYLLYAV